MLKALPTATASTGNSCIKKAATRLADQESGKGNMKQLNYNTNKEKLQMANDKNTQMKRLLKLFKTTPTLTVQFIIENLKLNSPRKVISELREKGVPIKDRWHSNIRGKEHLPRYKEYWIEPAWFESGEYENLF